MGSFSNLPFKRRQHFFLRKLRAQATEAERLFRCRLDSLGLDYRFQRTFYHPSTRIVDFYLPAHNLIIEIDGPYHDSARDRIRDNEFEQARGIRIVRFTNEQVLSGEFEIPCTIGVR